MELELKHAQLDEEEEKECAEREFVAHEEYVSTMKAVHECLDKEPTVGLVNRLNDTSHVVVEGVGHVDNSTHVPDQAAINNASADIDS